MEALNKSLEQVLQERNLTKKVHLQIDEVLQHSALKRWWQDHPEWSREDITRSIIKVQQFVKEQDHCEGCQGLQQCNNLLKGHCAELFVYGKVLDLSYSPCSYYNQAEQIENRTRLIKSHQVPKDIMKGTFKDFDKTGDGRIDAFNAVLEFCLGVQPGQNSIGLYLFGSLGVGKSYLLGAACNKLAERGIASYMVYAPDFFREMKGAIAEHKVDEKLQALKEVPVLIFDDIGAENISGWARDEVLGAILQYRVMEKLPTLYTSNYNYDQLEDHLAYSQKGGIEQLKAKRIMERIRHYTDAYFISGSNRRIR
jgi:primosomal protein DnaI